MQSEIEKLQKLIQKKDSDVSNDFDETVFTKIQDRANKSKNVFVHGVAENNSHDHIQRVVHDKKVCENNI